MDTFTLLLQIVFIWGSVIGKIAISYMIYSKSKNKGWMLIGVSSAVELFTKILSVGMSFWLREMVPLEELASFGAASKLVTTLLAIVYYVIAVVGFYQILSRINKFLAKKA